MEFHRFYAHYEDQYDMDNNNSKPEQVMKRVFFIASIFISLLQDVETIISSPSVTKILRDGQMFIFLNETVYNAQGIRMQ